MGETPLLTPYVWAPILPRRISGTGLSGPLKHALSILIIWQAFFVKPSGTSRLATYAHKKTSVHFRRISDAQPKTNTYELYHKSLIQLRVGQVLPIASGYQTKTVRLNGGKVGEQIILFRDYWDVSQGLMTVKPAASNGLVSRVAIIRPRAAVVAAI